MSLALGIAVAGFGLMNAGMSVWMIINPDAWIDAATRYCQHRFMHPIELIIVLGFGAIFLAYAHESVYSVAFSIVGYWFVVVGSVLILVGPSRHRRFGVWSIGKLRPFLRLAAIPWLFVCGWFVQAGLSAV